MEFPQASSASFPHPLPAGTDKALMDRLPTHTSCPSSCSHRSPPHLFMNIPPTLPSLSFIIFSSLWHYSIQYPNFLLSLWLKINQKKIFHAVLAPLRSPVSAPFLFPSRHKPLKELSTPLSPNPSLPEFLQISFGPPPPQAPHTSEPCSPGSALPRVCCSFPLEAPPPWLPCCAWGTPGRSPHGIAPALPSLECPSPGYLHVSLPHLVPAFAQMSPYLSLS